MLFCAGSAEQWRKIKRLTPVSRTITLKKEKTRSTSISDTVCEINTRLLQFLRPARPPRLLPESIHLLTFHLFAHGLTGPHAQTAPSTRSTSESRAQFRPPGLSPPAAGGAWRDNAAADPAPAPPGSIV